MKIRNKATSTKSARKQMGAHYTPSSLARFVADRTVARLDVPATRPIRVLDPACGDGQLLDAAIEALSRVGVNSWHLVGVEADPHALSQARARLAHRDTGSVELIAGDFLDLGTVLRDQQQLWSDQPSDVDLRGQFDIVVANPPYVRTQVLGAARAREIANRFDLSGRIDLYQAFVRAIAGALRNGGVLGVITSNRFMTTLAGEAIRGFLASDLELLEVMDLGDTKLFEAAVLPALLFARRGDSAKPSCPYLIPFTRVYSHLGAAHDSENRENDRTSIIDAIAGGDEGIVKVPEGTFAITRGRLPITPGSNGVWALVSSEESALLRQIRDRSDRTIEDLAFVRVGIKTTADEVFIRDDWAVLPLDRRPEDKLLRPILRHQDARRWAMPARYITATRVLYPHVVAATGRRAIDLDKYPSARSYLQSFRSRLEARRYVIDAGRKWYEIWVPQNPEAWALPKIVFPDISPGPRFCLVDEEYVVNGDCYWMTLRPGAPRDTLYLIMGVANSTLMTLFHDAAFSNKLYSGRRRYITQYVGKYPLPPEGTPAAQNVVSLVRELVDGARRGGVLDGVDEREHAVDVAVCEAFGFHADEVLNGTRRSNNG